VVTLIAGTLLLQAVIVGVLGVETKNRSLEEIAAEIPSASSRETVEARAATAAK
jgi:MFS transporter, putative metabolite:H+ symporter